MKSKVYQKVYKTLNIVGLIFSVASVIILLYFKDEIMKEEVMATCPDNYQEEMNKLRVKNHSDSITIEILEKDYYEMWEENQIFSSMLSEIESEMGHEILQKLWEKYK